ncbi:MAG: hypothetical protein ACJZ8M_03495 [Pseudohongiellaceae bacterium]|jgi:hypothetical protein|tara:strand:+ start:84 stop:551 length:468 start_codon:yes stop_codon:yes gene_type:complete
MRIFLILATLSLTPVTYAATGCILDMNGSWSLNPEKSLDPTNLVYEVLVFSNTAKEQRYLMKFENGPNDRGSLEWSVPCDGQDHPSPDFPWSTAPNATVAITRLGDKSEFVVQKEDGVLTTTYTRILADDDQTMISIGRNANQKVVWVRVFDKED